MTFEELLEVGRVHRGLKGGAAKLREGRGVLVREADEQGDQVIQPALSFNKEVKGTSTVKRAGADSLTQKRCVPRPTDGLL